MSFSVHNYFFSGYFAYFQTEFRVALWARTHHTYEGEEKKIEYTRYEYKYMIWICCRPTYQSDTMDLREEKKNY